MGLTDESSGEIARCQEVAEKIKAILKENNLAGHVLIAGRQSITFSLMLDATWMKLESVGDPSGAVALRFRAKKEDYEGNPDPNAQQKDVESTFGFLVQAGEALGEMGLNLMQIYEYFKKNSGMVVEHTESTFVPFPKK